VTVPGLFDQPDVVQAAMSQKIKLELQQVGATLASTAELAVYRDPSSFYDHLVHKLTAYVLADHLVSDTYETRVRVPFEVPASWWQHFKRDHLPTIAKRWPVKTRTIATWRDVTVTFDRYATYPEATIALPELGRHRYVEMVSHSLGEVRS
jgi:hypothetical protein